MSGPLTPHAVLRQVFGFDAFPPGQEEVIEAVLAGRDCIAVMPTGAGNSLTYQLPARILKGTVMVPSPLISLMKDQVDAQRELGFRVAEINSTLDLEERRARLAAFRRGEYEMEAVEAGARVLLVDEDTAATNFMIRDRRMQTLVPRKMEPITPFVDRIRGRRSPSLHPPWSWGDASPARSAWMASTRWMNST